MSTSSTTTHPEARLLGKLKAVADAIGFVEKRGRNDHHGYNFAQAVDVVRDVRAHLLAQGVVVVPAATDVRHEPIGQTRSGATTLLSTVELTYRFRDVETGASIEVPWIGTGADQGGDKGIYKAYTGGLKYALLSLFLLPTSDDPEHDALTDPESAAGQDRAKDAERPAAPMIPLDRAAAIAERAVAVGLAEKGKGGGYTFGPVMRAKLADVGVQKIGQLNVDQAEDVEAFLEMEAAHVGQLDAEGEA